MTIAATTPLYMADLDIQTDLDIQGYVSPIVTIDRCPMAVSSFDAFDVVGRADGTEVDGCLVEVSIAGVTRSARVRGSRWCVNFEAGALSRRTSGVSPATATIRDRWQKSSGASEIVMIEEFVDGFVYVDDVTLDVAAGALALGSLTATGEIGLGTHLAGRDLAVTLVAGDVDNTVVATGLVERGWDHGEFRARVPLVNVRPGEYRLKAVLTDDSCQSLTRLALSKHFTLR